jgi:predicted transglutaminase-like cysteine proteinase
VGEKMNNISVKRSSKTKAILAVLAGCAVAIAAAGSVQAAVPDPFENGASSPADIRFLGGLPMPGSFRIAFAEEASAPQITEIDHLIAQEQVAMAPAVDMIATGAITSGVFGSVAIPMHSFPASKRWRRVMAAIEACVADKDCSRQNSLLDDISGEVAGKPLLAKIAIVNREVNARLRYRSDTAVYGQFDYWATPQEILAKGAGDCEDFAILKMTSLIKAGVPANSLSLVVLLDNDHGAFHAVLALSTTAGSYILDNNLRTVPQDSALPAYEPLYSLSTDRAWIHGSRTPSKNVAEIKGSFSSVAPGEGFGHAAAVVGNDQPLAAALRPSLPAIATGPRG